MRCVPCSNVIASEAAFHGVPLLRPEDCDFVNLMVDEADDIDVSDGNCIAYVVGRGINGPQAGHVSLPQLRHLLGVAQRKIVLAPPPGPSSAITPPLERLKGQVPIVIQGDLDTWEETAEEIDDIFLGDAEVKRRSYSATANPRGGEHPVVTHEGHMILDVDFYGPLKLFGEEVPYEDIAATIESVPGVITHGLVVGVADAAIVRLGKNSQSEIMHVGRGEALQKEV